MILQFAKEPGPRMGSVVIRGARGDAENVGGFVEGHADEVTQLDLTSSACSKLTRSCPPP